ncbi:hypothetical protein [Paraburkholderia sediminicola]
MHQVVKKVVSNQEENDEKEGQTYIAVDACRRIGIGAGGDLL